MRMHKKFLGRYKFICDVDGMQYYSEDLAVRWDGAIVHKKNLHSRHPQELIRAVAENTSVRPTRVEPADIHVTDLALEINYLVDENGDFLIDENGDFLLGDPTLGTLDLSTTIPTATFGG